MAVPRKAGIKSLQKLTFIVRVHIYLLPIISNMIKHICSGSQAAINSDKLTHHQNAFKEHSFTGLFAGSSCIPAWLCALSSVSIGSASSPS